MPRRYFDRAGVVHDSGKGRLSEIAFTLCERAFGSSYACEDLYSADGDTDVTTCVLCLATPGQTRAAFAFREAEPLRQ